MPPPRKPTQIDGGRSSGEASAACFHHASSVGRLLDGLLTTSRGARAVHAAPPVPPATTRRRGVRYKPTLRGGYNNGASSDNLPLELELELELEVLVLVLVLVQVLVLVLALVLVQVLVPLLALVLVLLLALKIALAIAVVNVVAMVMWRLVAASSVEDPLPSPCLALSSFPHNRAVLSPSRACSKSMF